MCNTDSVSLFLLGAVTFHQCSDPGSEVFLSRRFSVRNSDPFSLMDPGLNSAFDAGFSSAAHAVLKLSPPASASKYWGHGIPSCPCSVLLQTGFP